MGHLNGHMMDYTLVQANGMYDFRKGEYWQEWLDFLGVDESILPQPQATVHPYGSLTIGRGRAGAGAGDDR